MAHLLTAPPPLDRETGTALRPVTSTAISDGVLASLAKLIGATEAKLQTAHAELSTIAPQFDGWHSERPISDRPLGGGEER